MMNRIYYGLSLMVLALTILFVSMNSKIKYRWNATTTKHQVDTHKELVGLHGVGVDGVLDVTIIPDGQEMVVFHYDDNKYKNKSKFNDGFLDLDFEQINNSFFNFNMNSETIKVEVHCKSLDSIVNSGVGDLSTKGELITPTLYVTNEGVGDCQLNIRTMLTLLKNNGVGDVEILGHTDSLNVDNGGTGDVDMKDLIALTGDIRHSGVGNLTINVTQSLSLINSGVGDIIYKGSPTIQSISDSGVGSIENH